MSKNQLISKLKQVWIVMTSSRSGIFVDVGVSRINEKKNTMEQYQTGFSKKENFSKFQDKWQDFSKHQE